LSLEEVVGRLVLADLPMVCLVVGPDGRVSAANRHSRELLGRAVVGEPFAELLVNFDQARPLAELLAPEGPSRRLNFKAFTGLPITFSCAFARHGEHTVVVGGEEPLEAETLRKELLQANQRLSATTRDLQKANAALTRLGAAKDQFLGMAAHDLRSPLVAILSYARLLKEEGVPGEARADLDALCAAAELTQRIVDGFLDLSVIQAGRLRLDRSPVALDRVLEAAAAVVRPAAARRGVVLTVTAAPSPPFQADAAKLEQVVVNLANNAVQHAPRGTEVRVRARVAGGAAFVDVTDHGPGVPPDLKRDLFRAYAHGAEQRGSAERSIGLGLAIARLIAEAHGGQLMLDSEPEKGTTATLRIPLQPGG